MASPKNTKKADVVDSSPVIEVTDPQPLLDTTLQTDLPPLVDTSTTSSPPPLEDPQPLVDTSTLSDPEPSGTTVPDISTITVHERVGVRFIEPYQRYSVGDLAGFGVDYANSLVERGVACWPEDFDAKTKKANDDDYPYAT